MKTPTERLFDIVAAHGPAAAETASRALVFASKAHLGQFRKSGDPYVTHSVAVAVSVAELGADIDTIVAALLHDVPEDTARSLHELRAEFTDTVADLLVDFARINHGEAVAEVTDVDPRAVILKVADRLHNMQTIQYLGKATQQHKSNQTLQLMVPLARSIGLSSAATELEALANATLRRAAARRERGTLATHRPTEAGIQTANRVLRSAAWLLPVRCRQRWQVEWEAELHTLPSRRSRWAFAANLLLGLPAMAVLTRRTRSPRDGARP